MPLCVRIDPLNPVYQKKYTFTVADVTIPVTFNVRCHELDKNYPQYSLIELSQEHDMREDTHIVLDLRMLGSEGFNNLLRLILAISSNEVANERMHVVGSGIMCSQRSNLIPSSINVGKNRFFCVYDVNHVENQPFYGFQISSRMAWFCWFLKSAQCLFPQFHRSELILMGTCTSKVLGEVVEELIYSELVRHLEMGGIVPRFMNYQQELKISPEIREHLEKLEQWWTRWCSTIRVSQFIERFGVAMSFLRLQNHGIKEPPLTAEFSTPLTLTKLKAMSVVTMLKHYLLDEPSASGPELLALLCLDPQLKAFIYECLDQKTLIMGLKYGIITMRSVSRLQNARRVLSIACPDLIDDDDITAAFSMKILELEALS